MQKAYFRSKLYIELLHVDVMHIAVIYSNVVESLDK